MVNLSSCRIRETKIDLEPGMSNGEVEFLTDGMSFFDSDDMSTCITVIVYSDPDRYGDFRDVRAVRWNEGGGGLDHASLFGGIGKHRGGVVDIFYGQSNGTGDRRILELQKQVVLNLPTVRGSGKIMIHHHPGIARVQAWNNRYFTTEGRCVWPNLG